jgi:MHS family proline/betaine transporter-like MFS transporter
VEQDQLLKSFGTFAGAFVMRPVGGLVLGMVGDKFGRKTALQFSIALMLVPSLLLAALPSYAEIGIASTLGLLIVRLMQGVAAGGELVGSMLYTVESAPQDKRGIFGAFAFSFAIIGTMMGNAAKAITVALLRPEQVKNWGWRVCYIAGFALGLFGKHLRKGLEESPEFEKAKAELVKDNVAPPNPLKEAFTKYYKEVCIVATSTSIWW